MSGRVVDATRPGSAAYRYFVESSTTPGASWRVDYLPGEHLLCSCPSGMRAGFDITAKPCRHKRAVLDLLVTAASA